MRLRDKWGDVLLAATALGWAAQIAFRLGEGSRSVWMDGALVGLDLVVAALFLWRVPVKDGPRLPLVLGAAAVAAAAIAMSAVEGPWSPAAQAVFVVGAVGTAVSLLTLGRSFAVLPAQRPIVSRGPYRLLRHPAYACELMMLVAALSPGGWVAWSIGGLAVAFQIVRVLIEERLLAEDPAYRDYSRTVRYRLLPLVF
ncbi:MAG: hypothetical protein JJ863_02760 [Deltaproteobacteria bacterium]|nr:hypothetical protein [Deltaproteobacteria bacterium]